MDLPEKIEDLEQLSAFESLTRTVEDQIADALSHSIEDNTILTILGWHMYLVYRREPRTDKATPSEMFVTELRGNEQHRLIKPLWETPENDEPSQFWISVHYIVLTYPDDEKDTRVARIPARYLFMSGDEVKKAWNKHIKRYGESTNENRNT